jgi:signal transduction histidine kinase
VPLRRLVDKLSLRVRLTLWVVGVSTIVKLAVAVVFYLYQASAVNTFFNEHLMKRTDGMMARLTTAGGAVTREDLEEISAQQSRNAMFTGFILSIFDADGNLVVSMRRQEPRYPVSRDELRSTAAERRAWFRRKPAIEIKRLDPDATMARSVVRGYAAADGRNYVLTAAASDTYAEHMISLVARALLIVVPTGIFVSGVCGWYIAGVAVRPLEEVRRAASQLTPESINRQVHVGVSSPELNRLQQELDNVRSRMAAAFAVQERFMSNVSHELKTPIAVMLTEAQTVDLKGAPPGVAAYVRSTCEELRRLGGMVDSFLLLTRVREGRSLTQTRVYPVNELLMESVAHCGPMAVQYEVRLEPALCGDDLDVCIRGDPSLLRTMLDNLIRNAIRFSPRGEPIHVVAAVDGESVLFRVRDHGPGIPEPLLRRIFDRFVQAPDEQRRGRGHGLGLEIAQGIAELHGGGITVCNCGAEAVDAGGNGTVHIPAGGCEFTVRLPRVQTIPEIDAATPLSNPVSAASEAPA